MASDLGPMHRVPHWILVLGSVLVMAYAGIALVVGRVLMPLPLDLWFGMLGMVTFSLVGALIEDRRPGNAIGRICLGAGLGLALATALLLLAVELDRQPGAIPPAGALVAVGAATASNFAIVLGGSLLVTRFPDGRAPGWLGRAVDGAILVVCLSLLLTALRPGFREYGWIEPTPNPIGLAVLGSPAAVKLFDLAFYAFPLVLAGGAVSLAVRYRLASPVARAQLRWFLTPIGTSAVLLILSLSTDGDLNAVFWLGWIASLMLTPIAIAVAILRYRLYEIDRIISRTIGYALLTAILAAVFLGTNLGLQTWVASTTGGSTVGVAASTLLVAALFQPLRRAVQAPIDRRFNRAHIDGQRTLAAFGDRVREEVDLTRLSGAVLATADEAVQPVAAGLWLR